MDDVSVVYYGHLFDATGYGRAARGYLHALHAAGVRLSAVDLMRHGRQVRDDLIDGLVDRGTSGDFHLFHGIPPQWARLAFPLRNAIGMTVWETDTMPLQWRTALSHVVEVWLPCDFNVSVFQRGLRTPIFKLPHVVDSRRWNGEVAPHEAELAIDPDDIVVYSIFEWQERKGPGDVLAAYLRAFADVRNTLLVVKTNPGASQAAEAALAQARAQTQSDARVTIRAEAWSDAQLEALHRRGDIYISLHRGEGWCYPLFDAAARGTPVVATAYGGPLEYLAPDTAELVRYDLVPVQQRYLYYHPSMRWAHPDACAAVTALRRVYADLPAARARAGEGARRIQHAYSPEAVGTTARAELMQLLQKTNTSRWQRIRRAEARERHSPPVPIPGEWYDGGYFEEGTKSNWQGGYTWASFGGLFTEAAAWLASTFDDDASFLDVGCAKGFLVRALRDAGRECWGIDHSPWAIEHAEAAARPYLTVGSADALTCTRRFDVIVALDLLSHLTEEQALAFLERAQAMTNVAIVAVISSASGTGADDEDQDLSHILMRPRDWWHGLFLRAGWRQDAIHRALARRCQEHDLPRKMGWQVYVYGAD